jgi:hypothetical protein
MVHTASMKELVAVFEEAKRLVTLPGNDFTWSSWEDAQEAVAELDRILGAIGRGELLPRVELSLIFASSGPLQEMSVGSGWSPEFLSLASRFESVAEKVYPRSSRLLPDS